MKSIDSLLQSEGASFCVIIIYFARILSRISFLDFPLYGHYLYIKLYIQYTKFSNIKISNFLNAIFSRKTYPSKHAFISNNTKCIIINCVTMILFTHDLRRHISRCSAGFFLIILRPYPSNTKICDF